MVASACNTEKPRVGLRMRLAYCNVLVTLVVEWD